MVGGLGLGYTAGAALTDPRVGAVRVVDTLAEVIEWHRAGLLPESPALVDDPRCELIEGDFFAMVRDGSGFGAGAPDRHDAVLLDIDHTPHHVLDPSHADLYEIAGLARLHDRIVPGGVFALWSDTRPDERFLADVDEVFDRSTVHEVRFPNPHTGGEAMNVVVVAQRAT